jgi:hypothetical protein
MGTYSWQLPAPPSITPSAGTAATLQQATARSVLGGLLDMLIDPVSLDYVDTEDGEFLETADSRTIVMMMIEIRLGESFTDPADGTRIKALLEVGDPVTPSVVIAETLRAMSILVDAGIISDVDATEGATVDGRFELKLTWRDLASGSPMDLVYEPFKG